MFRFNNNKGQSIIESVVALSAIVVVLAAIAMATVTSLNNSQYARSQSLASKYAQQAMETIRYVRNNDPTTFFTVWASNTYCMKPYDAVPATATQLFSSNEGIDGQSAGAVCNKVQDFPGIKLVREVKFSSTSSNCSNGTLATVNVYWSSAKCNSANRYCHKTQIVSCFANPSASGYTL